MLVELLRQVQLVTHFRDLVLLCFEPVDVMFFVFQHVLKQLARGMVAGIKGVVFLILAHLVIATATSPRLKMSLIILACAGSLGDIASYWLIRYVSPVFVVLQLLSWAGMWIGYGGMIIITLWDMWFVT